MNISFHEYAVKLRGGRMIFGYYDNEDDALQALGQLAPESYSGVWRGLNPLRSDSSLLATAPLHSSKHRAGAEDIARRSTLLLDFDAACASDVMSTESEHHTAIAQAGRCSDWLQSLGWARPKQIDSGRGCQLHVAVDLPADSSTDALVKHLLRSLKSRYGLMDAGMHDRPRLARFPGFWNRKAKSPTPERPHRMARLLDAGDVSALVSRAQIENVIAKIGLPAPTAYGGPEKSNPPAVDRTIRQLAEWLDRLGVELTAIETLSDGRTLLRLSHCPANPDHGRSSAGIGISVAGQPQNFCRHSNSCGLLTFSKWREVVEKRTGVKLQLGRKLIFKTGATN